MALKVSDIDVDDAGCMCPPKVTLAGATPADSDISGWDAGATGIGIGTDGSVWQMYKDGTAVKAIELSFEEEP